MDVIDIIVEYLRDKGYDARIHKVDGIGVDVVIRGSNHEFKNTGWFICRINGIGGVTQIPSHNRHPDVPYYIELSDPKFFVILDKWVEVTRVACNVDWLLLGT